MASFHAIVTLLACLTVDRMHSDTNFSDVATTWTQRVTVEQLIACFKDMPLDFSPGTLFRYSNSGYVLPGCIIERISKETYATFLTHSR